LTFLTNKGG